MQKTWRSHLLLAYSLAILAFLYVPLVILAMYSFNDSRINAVWTGFTFRWYEQLFNNRRVLEALINTLIIGFASTIVSTTLGTIAAIALHRYKYKMQRGPSPPSPCTGTNTKCRASSTAWFIFPY